MNALSEIYDKGYSERSYIEKCICEACEVSGIENISERAAAELATLNKRIARLEEQLQIAAKVKGNDKESFDWAVLTRIVKLENLLRVVPEEGNISDRLMKRIEEALK